MFRGLAIAMVLMSSSCTLWAEIYSWRDADGKQHFGDRVPRVADVEDAKEVELQELNRSDRVDIDYQRRTEDSRQAQYQAQVKQKQSAAQASQQRKLKQYCAKTQEEYVRATTFGKNNPYDTRTVFVDKDGKAISRHEQDRLAEGLRKEANARGCNISQSPGLKL